MTLPGGSPQQLISVFSGSPAFSPDGKTVAFYAFEALKGRKGMVQYVLESVDIDAGKQFKITDVVYGAQQYSRLSWTPNGQGIIYCGTGLGASVLWLQDIKGASPKPLVRFPYGEVYQFALAPDGKTIALSEGSVYSDVVVLTAR